MKQFAAWVIALIGLIGVAIAVILFGVRALSAPNAAQSLGFGQCEGLVCFWGVTPGVTTWDNARMILGERAQNLSDSPKLLSILLDSSNDVMLLSSVALDKVGRINYRNATHIKPPLTAGTLIEQYGLPCGVSLYYGEGIVTLRYPALLANIGIGLRAQSHLTIESPVYDIWLSDPAFHSKEQPDPCTDNITGLRVANTRWIGFTSIRNYINAVRR